jgi:hypothetical protein
MAFYQGTREVRYINMKQADGVTPIDITDWEFRAMLRKSPTASEVLAELTTLDGGFVTVDGPNGRFGMVFDDSLTAILPASRIFFDVLYNNAPDGPVWLFGGSFSVKTPITR